MGTEKYTGNIIENQHGAVRRRSGAARVALVALVGLQLAYGAPVAAQGLLGGVGDALGGALGGVGDAVGGVSDGLGLGGTVDVGSGDGGSGLSVSIGGDSGISATIGGTGSGAAAGSGTTPGTIGLTGSGIAGAAGTTARPSDQLRCTGDGNSQVFNGFPVIDRNGVQVGVVHDAQVNASLQIEALRFETTPNVLGGNSRCVYLTNIRARPSPGGIRVPTTMGNLIQNIALN